MLRILAIAEAFPRPNRMLFPWALEFMRGLKRAGHEVRVVSFRPWFPQWLRWPPQVRNVTECPSTHDFDGIPVEYPRWLIYRNRRMPVMPPRRQDELAVGWLSARGPLMRNVEEFKPDVLLTISLVPTGLIAHRISQRTGLPYLMMLQDFKDIPEAFETPGLRKLAEPAAVHASNIIVVGGRMRRQVEEYAPKASPIHVSNGISEPPPHVFTTPRPAEAQGKTIVAAAGLFGERKNFPLLVSAFARVVDEFPDAVLRIVGFGDEEQRIRDRIREHNLTDRVTMVGKRSHDGVRQELAWTDVFILPSRDEPFATVYLEAASVGCPCVWCTDGGINDVLVDGEHGCAIPPDDVEAAANALRTLLRDPERRRQMGRNCRALYDRELNGEAFGRKMTEILTRAVESGKSARTPIA